MVLLRENERGLFLRNGENFRWKIEEEVGFKRMYGLCALFVCTEHIAFHKKVFTIGALMEIIGILYMRFWQLLLSWKIMHRRKI